jgi:hypothetical protein
MRGRFVAVGAATLMVVGGFMTRELNRIGVNQGYAPDQPIRFSHRIHAGANSIPCLYCHYAARTSRHAGIPPANICVNCHRILDKQTIDIEKLKEAVQMQRPIKWIKIHNLPDFVYFNHSQHVLSGVACQRCHGPVEEMDRVRQFAPLTMGWCLDCHREHALEPVAELRRAILHLTSTPAPSAGLDCASCHY